jgi:hypothetical protein
MIENLPTYISLTFGLTTFATLMLFIWTIRESSVERTQKTSTPVFFGLAVWLIIQATLTLKNIYSADTTSFPPKIFPSGILPTFIIIILLFVTRKGRQFIDSLPLKNLTWVNIVRIPVEIVLLWLFLNKTVPKLMTFEGRNFDILAGITAPFVAIAFAKQKIGRKGLLVWNVICLGLLINIVVNAFLSVPSPNQKFGLDQPNIAILYFPFSWLPTFVVPVVLFGHLTSIRQLIKQKPVSSGKQLQ